MDLAVSDPGLFKQARLIAFDNDGTLYPAGQDVARVVLIAHREFVKEHGLAVPTPSLAWINHLLGADASHFYGAMLPDEPPAVQREFEEFCLTYEEEAVKQYSSLYPGAAELLADLHRAGKTMVLISNGSPRYVDQVWESCGYARWMAAKYPYGPPEFSSKGERMLEAMATFGFAVGGGACSPR
jgi:phosphoglycolate phosphatase-like HAD superfamily hydrolase